MSPEPEAGSEKVDDSELTMGPIVFTPAEKLRTATHELSHYAMARLFGIRPRGLILGYHVIDETDYLAALRQSQPIEAAGLIDIAESIKALLLDHPEREDEVLYVAASITAAGAIGDEIISGIPVATNQGASADGRLMQWFFVGTKIRENAETLKQLINGTLQDVRQAFDERPLLKELISSAAQTLSQRDFTGTLIPFDEIEKILHLPAEWYGALWPEVSAAFDAVRQEKEGTCTG